jgi:hypothetical protein
VNENHCPVTDAFTKSVSYSRLRVNHYYTKSMQEAREKWRRPMAAGGPYRQWSLDWLQERLDRERDTTITRFAPAVRDAIMSRVRSTTQAFLVFVDLFWFM